jgi:hypothetical protein
MVVAVVGVTPGLWRECGTSDQREAAGPVVSVAGEGAPRYRVARDHRLPALRHVRAGISGRDRRSGRVQRGVLRALRLTTQVMVWAFPRKVYRGAYARKTLGSTRSRAPAPKSCRGPLGGFVW